MKDIRNEKSKVRKWWFPALAVIVAFCLAAFIRIILPYHQVFVDQDVRFSGVDAYYHMRLVDNLLHHYPHRIVFDPYIRYPSGTAGLTARVWPSFFDWLLGGIILLIGLGHPSQQVIDRVGAYFPAILGALSVVPVYWIGKTFSCRWVGALAACLLAVLPGEFLGRSILGFTDHHVAEFFFTTVMMAFLFLAVRPTGDASRVSIGADQFHQAGLRQAVGYGFAAGIFLGIYLTTWTGGLLFVILLVLFFAAQSVLDFIKGVSSASLMIAGTVLLATASMFSLWLLPHDYMYMGSTCRYFFPLTLLAGTVTPGMLFVVSGMMRRARCRPVWYPAALFIILGLGIIGIWALTPGYFNNVARELNVFRGLNKTILETWPLFYPAGSFSLALMWDNFTTVFAIGLVALVVLIKDASQNKSAEKTLLVVWSLVILVLTLASRRFAYYLAVNLALLAGWLMWRLLSAYCGAIANRGCVAGIAKQTVTESLEGTAFHKGRLLLGLFVMVLVVYLPNVKLAMHAARHPPFSPGTAWVKTLTWLKNNSPEPFGDPDYYYTLYERPANGSNYLYPASAYGIMAWWDYGHWILRMTHRLPISTPFQWGAGIAGRFFTAPDEASANGIMANLQAKYVIADYETALAKFSSTVSFAGKRTEDYLEDYYIRDQSGLKPVLLFYPNYYRSMSVRLYCFNGRAVKSRGCPVYAWKKDYDRNGACRKVILGSRSFASVEAAETYIASQKSGEYVIAGDNPFICPVDIEDLKHYRLVYASPNPVLNSKPVELPPEIKIFEYVK